MDIMGFIMSREREKERTLVRAAVDVFKETPQYGRGKKKERDDEMNGTSHSKDIYIYIYVPSK